MSIGLTPFSIYSKNKTCKLSCIEKMLRQTWNNLREALKEALMNNLG